MAFLRNRGALIFFVAVSGLAYLRIYFGISQTDELQYLGSAVIKSLGGRAFVNESYIQQIGSLLFSPLTDIYVFLVGSLDGIILYSHHLYFILYFGLALSFYFVLKACCPRDKFAALIAALTYLVYAHNILPALCYNTMGTAFLAFGILAFLLSRVRWAVPSGLAAGACLGLSLASYPTLLAVAAIFLALLGAALVLRRDLRPGMIKRVLATSVGFGVTSLLVALWLWSYGWENLADSFAYTKLFNIGGSFAEKRWFLNFHLGVFDQGWEWAAGLLLTGLACQKWIPRPVTLFAAYFTLSCFNRTMAHPSFAQGLITLIAVGSFDQVFRRRNLSAFDYEIFLWTAALLLAAPFVGWTSSGTVHALPIVTQIAASFVIFALAASVRKWDRFAAIAMLTLLFSFYLTSFMTDQPLGPEIALMDQGPAAGMFTFKKRKDFLKSVEADLAAAEKFGKTVLIPYYGLGYFQSHLQIHAKAILMHGLEKPGVLESHQAYFRQNGPPDIYFELKRYPSLPPAEMTSLEEGLRLEGTRALQVFLSSIANYRIAINREDYAIWYRVH